MKKEIKRQGIILVLLAISLLFFSETIQADVLKVRITVKKANLRLKPTTNSQVITTLPLGAVLEVEKKINDWYYVKLPKIQEGFTVTGYIHMSLVGVIREIEQKKEMEEEPIKPKEEKSLKITQKVVRPKLFMDPNYLKWKEDYFKTERDFKKAQKTIYSGLAAILAGGLISGIAGATAEDDYTGVLVGGGISFAGAITWLYGLFKRTTLFEKMHLLMNRGWINGYVGVWQRVGTEEVKGEVKEMVERVVKEEKPERAQPVYPIERVPGPPKEPSFKVGGGMSLPLGDWADYYNMGLGVNGSLILPVHQDIDFVGEIRYSRFGGKEEKPWGMEAELAFSRFIFTGNGRYNFRGRIKFFTETGLGIYYDRLKTSIAEGTFSETESDTNIGFRFGGGGIVMDKIELTAVFHLVEDSNMFSISASYRF